MRRDAASPRIFQYLRFAGRVARAAEGTSRRASCRQQSTRHGGAATGGRCQRSSKLAGERARHAPDDNLVALLLAALGQGLQFRVVKVETNVGGPPVHGQAVERARQVLLQLRQCGEPFIETAQPRVPTKSANARTQTRNHARTSGLAPTAWSTGSPAHE
jgi:hypothetical protein